GGTSAVLAAADVTDFFTDEFPRLGGRSRAFALGAAGPLESPLFRHVRFPLHASDTSVGAVEQRACRWTVSCARSDDRDLRDACQDLWDACQRGRFAMTVGWRSPCTGRFPCSRGGDAGGTVARASSWASATFRR